MRAGVSRTATARGSDWVLCTLHHMLCAVSSFKCTLKFPLVQAASTFSTFISYITLQSDSEARMAEVEEPEERASNSAKFPKYGWKVKNNLQ